MRTIKLINDSTRFSVTNTSPSFVQGVRLRDGRVVTFCRYSGKIVKNCSVIQENQACNRALIRKIGFSFLSLVLLVLLFVSCSTSKNASFNNVLIVQNAKIEQVYTVKFGDNLSKVFGYKKGLQVCAKNKLDNCDRIFPDQNLKF